MAPEQREVLRQHCLTLLSNSNVKPDSKKGRELAYAFYVGTLAMQLANKKEPEPYLIICLMSGRIDDLLKEPK